VPPGAPFPNSHGAIDDARAAAVDALSRCLNEDGAHFHSKAIVTMVPVIA
jgi:hypothetical protein